jgi:hypothetical protein
MPTPTNVTKIKKNLVAIEFYLHYFQDFASKATLMCKFLKKDENLNWTNVLPNLLGGILVKKSRKYMIKNIGCNILVIG